MATINVKPLVAGNWKMNGLTASLAEASKVRDALKAQAVACDVVICPPATLIAQLNYACKGSALMIGGQDCHAKVSGAHTGDIAAEMLKDAGARFVIVGHSERRADHAETDAIVRAKAEAAHRAGLVAVVCAGETIDQRKAGKTLAIVSSQVAGSIPQTATAVNTIVAYEPVWAVGTGLTPSISDIAEVHGALRAQLSDRWPNEGRTLRLLYGGSVKPSNARELMAVENVDGALVGGASLKAEDFLGIIGAYSV
jgi:triosephosphate isomerase (TIM)